LLFNRVDLVIEQALEARLRLPLHRDVLVRLAAQNVDQVVVTPAKHRGYRHQR